MNCCICKKTYKNIERHHIKYHALVSLVKIYKDCLLVYIDDEVLGYFSYIELCKDEGFWCCVNNKKKAIYSMSIRNGLFRIGQHLIGTLLLFRKEKAVMNVHLLSSG